MYVSIHYFVHFALLTNNTAFQQNITKVVKDTGGLIVDASPLNYILNVCEEHNTPAALLEMSEKTNIADMKNLYQHSFSGSLFDE